ncbi:MAG: hypothetical protein H7A23_26625 [Leptospiraceae bacterium]|nr:hypothetical protein [Leptospiraceae bacterium]MCP5498148.1 hypothetical protein [Leptospiraceae bacterium]
MITKSFKEWDSEEIEKTFGITRLWNTMPELNELLDLTGINTPQNEKYEELREWLYLNADAWNKDELKMFFIDPLLSMIKFYHLPYYKAFTQRTMRIKTDTVDSKGEVEFFVGVGFGFL